jgi:hypothetical protein
MRIEKGEILRYLWRKRKRKKEMRRRIKNIEMKMKMKMKIQSICEIDDYNEMEEDCTSAENVNCLDSFRIDLKLLGFVVCIS